MPNKNSRRPKRPIDTDLTAGFIVDAGTGDTLFEQPLVDDGMGAADAESSSASKGGKARAKKIGKAKQTAIAERIRRSRPKR